MENVEPYKTQSKFQLRSTSSHSWQKEYIEETILLSPGTIGLRHAGQNDTTAEPSTLNFTVLILAAE